MGTVDYMSERERQDLRDAGRGHLLGEYRSPLDVADEARKRAREEPQGDGIANTGLTKGEE